MRGVEEDRIGLEGRLVELKCVVEAVAVIEGLDVFIALQLLSESPMGRLCVQSGRQRGLEVLWARK